MCFEVISGLRINLDKVELIPLGRVAILIIWHHSWDARCRACLPLIWEPLLDIWQFGMVRKIGFTRG